MKIAKLALLLCIISNGAYAEALAEPTDELLYTLKDSLVKVITATKSGGHGFGTGVAISKDHVVTNCHVLSNASGIGISRWGVEYTPVSLQADWRHDICILKFEWADLKPVKIADSDILQYEQAIISISMPSDSPAPYVALSAVKALVPSAADLICVVFHFFKYTFKMVAKRCFTVSSNVSEYPSKVVKSTDSV